MKKRNKVIAVIILVVIVGLVIVYELTKQTTFAETVTKNLNMKEISSIEIIKSIDTAEEDKTTVTNPDQIASIMDSFSRTNLKKSRLSNIKYKASYWITIKTTENRKLGITLYDKNYLNIFEYNSKKSATKSYKITNEFDSTVIQNLFE